METSRILTALDKNNIFRVVKVIDEETGEALEIEEFLKKTGAILVNDLSCAFFEIYKVLKKMGYQSVFEIKKPKQFAIGYNSGTCSSIKIKHEQGELRLIDFEKKFLRPFGDRDSNRRLLSYAESTGRSCYTVGRDSFNEWLQMRFRAKGQRLNVKTCERLFREDYPVFEDSVVTRAKDSVSGYQYAQKGFYQNVYSYDICSSFPSQLLNDTPTGLPVKYDRLENVPETYFYVVKFTAMDIEVKPGKIDFLKLGRVGVSTQCLTKHLFLLFKRNYNYTTLKIKEIRAFKTRKGCFTSFVQKNVLDGKMKENDKVLAKYNKAIANAIVGYMGKNTQMRQTKLTANGVRERVVECPPIYLPIYLYVNGKAKAEFIETLQRQNGVVYANTDGFLTTEPTSLLRLNIGRTDGCGAYIHKDTFKEMYIETINGYTGLSIDGTIDNTLSGMTVRESISVGEYQNKSFEYEVHELTPSGVAVKYVSPTRGQ